jgi:peptide/nickel transport system permease protein
MGTLPGHLRMNPILQDLIIVGAFALVFALIRAGAHNERWQRALRRFRADRLGVASLVIVVLYLTIGALEMLQIPAGNGGTRSLLDWLSSGVPAEKTFSAPLAKTLLDPTKPEPLKGLHLLGTDALGKDVFVESLRACKTALLIGGLTSVIYLPVGTLLGILAGYFRRRTDDVIQYVYSTVASIPTILLLVSIIMVLGKSVTSMAVALGATGWVGICRLMRGETLRQAERPYVAAARCLGQSHWKIVTRHLLPNVMHLVLINFVLGFSGLVLSEAILSYLGVGSPVGTPSWGCMIDQARSELSREPIVWWNITAASAALFGLVLSLNMLGDALRRAFDPKAT